MNSRRLALVVAHHDDAEFMAGGVIHALSSAIASGEIELTIVTCASRELNTGETLDEALASQLEALAALGVLKRARLIHHDWRARFLPDHEDEVRLALAEVRERADPTLVISHSPNDPNQDHASLARQVARVFRSTSILAGEIPRNGHHLRPNAFWAVSEADVRAKIAALACYEREARKPYFDPEVILGNARVRGVQGRGEGLAEAFEVVTLQL